MQRLIKTPAIVVVASVLALGVAGCGSKYREKIIGVWNWNVGMGTLVMTINADGTGSIKAPGGEKPITWRIQKGRNFVMTESGKDSGFLIDSADENTIMGSDPKAPGQKIIWSRKR